MNVKQALQSIHPTLPGEMIMEAPPSELPHSPYFVISDLTDGDLTNFYRDATGHKAQARRLTVLVTLYGKEGWKVTDLIPWFTPVRRFLADRITEHPGLPPLSGVTRGAVIPPTPDRATHRPMASIRLHLTYLD